MSVSVMNEAEVTALVRLLRATKDPALLEDHAHPTDILIDIVGCKVCWAEREVLDAARLLSYYARESTRARGRGTPPAARRAAPSARAPSRNDPRSRRGAPGFAD